MKNIGLMGRGSARHSKSIMDVRCLRLMCDRDPNTVKDTIRTEDGKTMEVKRMTHGISPVGYNMVSKKRYVLRGSSQQKKEDNLTKLSGKRHGEITNASSRGSFLRDLGNRFRNLFRRTSPVSA